MRQARIGIILVIVSCAALSTRANAQPECASNPNLLWLQVPDPTQLCLQPGETVTVRLWMTCLQQPVSGYQAFLGFESNVLEFLSGSYMLPDPFGLPILFPITANGNAIDLAAGINIFAGQPPTAADAMLVELVFRSRNVTGATAVAFRPHQPASRFSVPGDTYVNASTVDSPVIQVSASCVTACSPEVGDVNQDGQITEADVAAAVDVLLGLDLTPSHVAATDANCDGVADGDDIQPFLEFVLEFI